MLSTGGCGYEIYDGKTHRLISDRIFGSPIYVFDKKINDYNILTVYSHGGAASGVYETYAFDGKNYSCVSLVDLKNDSLDDFFNTYESVPELNNQFNHTNNKSI
ncbi:MAG: hypothetical protein HQL15_00190 [Candidatus Omnitrophica bacterium]|nr:hypothetical protein [Candidatus Omnitrophota bacterium]